MFNQFDRDVNVEVKESLDQFMYEFKINVNSLDFKIAELFSKFITASADCTYEHRYSISKLSQIFNNEKLPTAELLKIYMIALMCLQKNEQGTKFIW